ncbi:AAA family ATPase, partial [Acinetobacter baumannii]|nr:AAA family ATPase [Acinetobacter baumannii]
HGADALTRLPPAAYEPAVSAQVYATLRRQARRVLAAGHCAVADAVFDRPDARAAIAAAAEELGIGFCGIWLEAPAATLARRVEGRTNDPSD